MPIKQTLSFGDSFSIGSDIITINKDGIYKLSACAYFQSAWAISNLYINKGSSQIARSIYQRDGEDGYYSVNITPLIVKLVKGDKITLHAQSQTSSAKVIAYQNTSRLTIEKIG